MSSVNTKRVSSICNECGAPMDFELGTLQVQCSHCEAGMVVEQGQRLVRLDCPRCRGNFYYLDGSMCGHCPYCDASLLAVCEGRLLRFIIRPQEAAQPRGSQGAKLLLLPFWHMGGLLYGWDVGSRVTYEEPDTSQNEQQDAEAQNVPIRNDTGPMKFFRGRVVDIHQPDPATLALGVTSLRLRAAVFPLEPFDAEHESLGQVVPAIMDLEDVRSQLYERTMNPGRPTEGMTRLDCQRLDLVSTTISLYYYPFWVRSRSGEAPEVWDGVTGNPETLGTPVDAPEAAPASAFDSIKMIELICEKCGAPLPAGNHSMVLPCTACGLFWQVTRDGLQPFSAHFARSVQEAGDLHWLPFWRIPSTLNYGGKQASRVLDMRNVLGMIKPLGGCPSAPPSDPLSYYVAAYGAMKMPRIDHAARDMTRTQPLLKKGQRPGGEIFHCFYGPQDARDLAYVTWMLIVPGTVPHRLRSLRIQTGEPELWYVPFADRGRELVNQITGVRYDRSAFKGVRH